MCNDKMLTLSNVIFILMCLLVLGKATELLVADRMEVKMIDTETLLYTTITHAGSDQLYAVAWNSETGDIFYSDLHHETSSTVWWYSKRDSQSLRMFQAGVVPGLAVDWVHSNLYYIDENQDTVNVRCLATGTSKVLYKGSSTDIPRSIRVDPRSNQRYVYWSDWGSNPHIKRCGLDGKNCKIIVYTNIDWPNSLSIDFITNKLYWIDSGPAIKRIYRCNLDGTSRETIGEVEGDVRGLDVESQHGLFWTSRIDMKVKHMKCDSTWCVVDQSYTGFDNPIDVQVHEDYRQPSGENKCKSARCPLCLPSAASTGKSYTCYEKDGSERVTCLPSCATCKTSYSCTTCPYGYTGSTCTVKTAKCLPGCRTCRNSNRCTTCKAGYTGTKCDKKKKVQCLTNCKSCKDSYSCTSCKRGYSGVRCDKPKACKINNCEKCEAYICKKCASGYRPTIHSTGCGKPCWYCDGSAACKRSPRLNGTHPTNFESKDIVGCLNGCSVTRIDTEKSVRYKRGCLPESKSCSAFKDSQCNYFGDDPSIKSECLQCCTRNLCNSQTLRLDGFKSDAWHHNTGYTLVYALVLVAASVIVC